MPAERVQHERVEVVAEETENEIDWEAIARCKTLGVTAGASVTPAQMASLVRTIERLHVKAIFVELEENPKLADQIASAAHVKVVTGLLDHSLTSPSGPAPDYIAMMKYDTHVIVENLK